MRTGFLTHMGSLTTHKGTTVLGVNGPPLYIPLGSPRGIRVGTGRLGLFWPRCVHSVRATDRGRLVNQAHKGISRHNGVALVGPQSIWERDASTRIGFSDHGFWTAADLAP